jgi:hypothetical protein
MPDPVAHNGFQLHLFLVPGGGGTESSPDWNQPNILFLDIRAGAGGTGSATFRFKVNQAAGNSQLYAAGLPSVNSAQALGKWSVTATANSHFVITAPDGSTTAYDMAADAAAAFAGPLRLYVGVQGNDAKNIGERARISGISVIKDSTAVLEDSFTGDALDTTKWVSQAGVQFLAASEAGYLVTWTLPDDGFSLQFTEAMEETPFWVNVTAVPYALGPGRRQVNIPPAALSTTGQMFFRMSK